MSTREALQALDERMKEVDHIAAEARSRTASPPARSLAIGVSAVVVVGGAHGHLRLQPFETPPEQRRCDIEPVVTCLDGFDCILVAPMESSIVDIELDGSHAAGLAAFGLKRWMASNPALTVIVLDRDPDVASRRRHLKVCAGLLKWGDACRRAVVAQGRRCGDRRPAGVANEVVCHRRYD